MSDDKQTPFDPTEDDGAEAGDTTEHSDVPSDGDSSAGSGGDGNNTGGEGEG